MKRVILPIFMLLAKAGFALQSAVNPMPVEEAKPINWLWWAIGVILAIGAGMLLYVLIKKDPKKDAI